MSHPPALVWYWPLCQGESASPLGRATGFHRVLSAAVSLQGPIKNQHGASVHFYSGPVRVGLDLDVSLPETQLASCSVYLSFQPIKVARHMLLMHHCFMVCHLLPANEIHSLPSPIIVERINIFKLGDWGSGWKRFFIRTTQLEETHTDWVHAQWFLPNFTAAVLLRC